MKHRGVLSLSCVEAFKFSFRFKRLGVAKPVPWHTEQGVEKIPDKTEPLPLQYLQLTKLEVDGKFTKFLPNPLHTEQGLVKRPADTCPLPRQYLQSTKIDPLGTSTSILTAPPQAGHGFEKIPLITEPVPLQYRHSKDTIAI